MKNFKNLKYVDNINEVYIIKNKLGQGSFGSVNRAVRVGGGIDMAIKIIDKTSLNNNPMLPTLMMSELTVLKKCSHPNIMSVSEILEDN
jgi:serine/threonine protein kinase